MPEHTPRLETNHRPHDLYEPRSGERIEEYTAKLSADALHPLSKTEKAEAQSWNASLALGKCEIRDKRLHVNGSTESLPEYDSLAEAVNANSYLSKRHEINLDYFALHYSAQDARKSLHEAGIIPHGDVHAKAVLRQAFLKHTLTAPTGVIKKLADASKRSEDMRMTHELAHGKVPHVPERVIVFSDGTQLMERLRVLRQYKDYYVSVKRELVQDDDGSNLAAAKRMYTDLYIKSVNAQLADTYPDVLAFWYQAKHMNEPKRSIFVGAIEQAFPAVSHLRADFLRKRSQQLFVRLDRIRNGASSDDTGSYSAISEELVTYLDTQNDKELDLKPHLSSDEIATFTTEKLNAIEMKQLAEHVLSSIGLLSADESEVSKDRKTRAQDGKWQVIIREDIDSMGVEDPPGTFEIPANFLRTIAKDTAPVGVISGLVHELTHVIQHDNKRSQGDSGIGATVKGKNQTVYFEAGGIRNEDRVQRELFGRGRQQAPHYMRAMRVLEAGGTEGEAIKAFYDSYRADNPNDSKLNAGKAAVSRVMRLARRRGGYNSQPLNYAETGLIIAKTQHLSDHIKGLLFDYGAFNIADLASLHDFGVLPKRVSHYPYSEIVDATLEGVRDILKHRQSQAIHE